MNKKETPKKVVNMTGTSWDNVAEWYDGLLEESADSFQAKVILPNLLRVLDIKPGMKVLDVACGQGYFARALNMAGAQVTGVDISKELIAVAKERSQKTSKPIDFYIASADALTFAEPEAFDAAVIILSLQNIENIQGVFFECSRVLKKSGRLVVALNHPAFRIPKSSSWEWDEKAGKQYRRTDSYLSDARFEIDMTPGEKDLTKKKMTLSFHRPLQSYFKALNKAGFTVTRLEEWISHRKSQKGPRAAEEDRVRKEIPMFLMLESVKS